MKKKFTMTKTVGILMAFVIIAIIGCCINIVHYSNDIPEVIECVVTENPVTIYSNTYTSVTTVETTTETTMPAYVVRPVETTVSAYVVKSVDTTTTMTTTTTTTEDIYVEPIVIETITITEHELIYEEEPDNNSYYYTDDTNMVQNYTINELTYYSGPLDCYGSSGRTLINNYSIACNSLPEGTIVHIESDDGSINGDYRVDDTGGMGYNVIDIFYSDYSYVPYPFSRDGRISCTVWVIG